MAGAVEMQISGVMLGVVVDGVSTCQFFQQLLKPVEEKSWSESTNLLTFWNHTGQDPPRCPKFADRLTCRSICHVVHVGCVQLCSGIVAILWLHPGHFVIDMS